MSEENQLSFVEAVRGLDAGAIMKLLPIVTTDDLSAIRQNWLRGDLGELDPTNVLSAGDFADQFLSLPEHAVALYDAALEYLDQHPESIAGDTDCAAASLNLLGILETLTLKDRMPAAALRAARMPVKEDRDKVRLAYLLHQTGEFFKAEALFLDGMKGNPGQVAEETGIPLDDLRELGRAIASAARMQSSNPKLPQQIRDATQLTGDFFVRGLSSPPLWNGQDFYACHPETYRSSPDRAQYEAALPHWNQALGYYQQDDPNAALRDLYAALRAFPGFIEARGMAVSCWLDVKRPEEALRVLDNALANLDGDYPEFRAMRARALAAIGQAEQAAVEWIKELYVVGSSAKLLRSILQASLNLLPKNYDLPEYRRKRNVLEVGLACSGRLLDQEGGNQLAGLFAKLYSRYELVGPVAPERIAYLTGMEWERARGVFRAHAD